jgi:effector-binding domain-containing protein
MGIRTTDPIEVVYRELEPGEAEAPAISQLLGVLIGQNPYDVDKYDHSIVVHYDPPDTTDARRELMIPINGPVVGLKTKTFPSVRGAFLVYKDTDTSQEEYYKVLLKYIEEEGHKASDETHSIEIMYVPEDLDSQDFTIELMIPLAD